MRLLPLVALLVASFDSVARQSLPPLGTWREHLPYRNVIDLETGNGRVYAATQYSLFTLTVPGNETERFSRVTGLSETGVSQISYNVVSDKLCIAYQNSNIDILDGATVINIPDIMRDQRPGDKSVYDIYAHGNNFYLATGIGIIVIDADRYEVSATWLIGENGQPVKANSFAAVNGYFYAATSSGLQRVAINGSNPADYNNWELLSGGNGLPPGNADQVLLWNQSLFVRIGNNIYRQDNDGAWQLFFEFSGKAYSFSADEQLYVSGSGAAQSGVVLVVDATGTVVSTISNPSTIIDPRKALRIGSITFVADAQTGLVSYDGDYTAWYPSSPHAPAAGQTIIDKGHYYAASGTFNTSAQANHNGIYIFNNDTWSHWHRRGLAFMDSFPDINALAIDRRDRSVWAGSFSGGLAHRQANGNWEIFKQGKLGAALNNPAAFRVSGLFMDDQFNLWISNYGAAAPLVVLSSDNTWTSYFIPFSIPGNALTTITSDDAGHKWIVAANGGGLLCLDDRGTPHNTADDQWKRLLPGAGSGNLPGTTVTTIAKDKSGFLWIGTDNGIGVLQCAESIFSSTACETTWPVVQDGNFAGYLFQGEQIRSIAVDGADRKWVATANGAWLVSPEGDAVIFRFSVDNSPLLSNDVNSIAIDPQTGEVFFSTANGICSFRSTATEAAEQTSDVVVFPNPVPPGYSGTIGIRNVPANAVVKITELNGRLVWQGRALGAQSVWDGRDYKGRKISTGVYLVLVSSDDRKEKVAGKIIFINR